MANTFFITFEGPDGGGKTTQLRLTAEWLRTQGLTVTETREPGGTPRAEELRRLVLSPDFTVPPRTELWLYLAARAAHVESGIRPALAEGRTVLCDRFNDSTLVYQGLVRGLPLDELRVLTRAAAGGLEPDLTILLDGDPLTLARRRDARGVADRMELEGLDFQVQVRNGFLQLAQTSNGRIQVVDALQAPEVVQKQIRTLITEHCLLKR